MNKERRKAIDSVIARVEEAKSDLETLRDEEQEYVDNMPENMQGSDRYERAESALESLEEAVDRLDEVVGALQAAQE